MHTWQVFLSYVEISQSFDHYNVCMHTQGYYSKNVQPSRNETVVFYPRQWILNVRKIYTNSYKYFVFSTTTNQKFTFNLKFAVI